MKTFKFLFRPWDGQTEDQYTEEVRAVNQLGAWEKAHDLAKEKRCTVITLLSV